MTTARLREVLTGGSKERRPPSADGTLSIAPDSAESTQLCQRHSSADFVPTTSRYLETEAGDFKPSDLYGKFTWTIERFSETSKRELRSEVFEVGPYKWYILVYPAGCDVCNHLSLFLCVADYDKLPPGWSHFAQFTIAVINKDHKDHKYSDTLHRFCKKEHDWGWKKFMELRKIREGFAVNDTLEIKAIVQVIKYISLIRSDRAEMGFQGITLTGLSVVWLLKHKLDELAALGDHLGPSCDFWKDLTGKRMESMCSEAEGVVLKGLVKRFFNEKEVTSTLMMDLIFSGCRQIEEQSSKWIKGKSERKPPRVLINAKSGVISLIGDVKSIVEELPREVSRSLMKNDKQSDCTTARSHLSEDLVNDSLQRDQRRLAELGRGMVEIFTICHIFKERIERAYQEAECLKIQEELLREEEEAQKKEELRRKNKAKAEREKRARKQEKKRAREEAEKKQKEKEEAERRQREQERKQEADRKRREDLEKKSLRIIEAQVEIEQQQALNVSNECETRIDEKSNIADPVPVPAPIEACIAKPRAVKSNMQPTRPEAEKKTTALQKDPEPKLVASADKTKEEIKSLKSTVEMLEAKVIERDNTIRLLQQKVDYLQKREQELETELSLRSAAHRPTTRPTGIHAGSMDSPSSSRSRTAARHYGLDYASVVGRGSHPGTKTCPRRTSRIEQSECGEGRSHSSGEETFSDTAFIDQGRLQGGFDYSQLSTDSTPELRSTSSFGTQLEHTFPESDNAYSRGESVASEGTRRPQMPTAFMNHFQNLQLMSGNGSCPPRANSVASSLPSRNQGYGQGVIDGSMTERSYSLDLAMRYPTAGFYDPSGCPEYSMQEQFLLCQAMQGGMGCSELPVIQANLHAATFCDGMVASEGGKLEDFAHLALIKDLLE